LFIACDGSFFSSLKTERMAKVYRTRDQAKADVFDYVERFITWFAGTRPLGYLGAVGSKRKLD